MKAKSLASVVAFLMLASCASSNRNRDFVFSVSAGAAVGAGSGAALSPNAESRPWNAVIFGLTGALVGGALNYLLSNKEPAEDSATKSLLEREKKIVQSNAITINPPVAGAVPDFLKNRVTNLVIEELTLPSTVSEDGVLQEPHKAYRIKQQPELLPLPSNLNSGANTTPKKDRK